MARLDFSDYLSDDRLPLDNVKSDKHPNGKTYYVPSPSAKFTLQLRRMMELWGEQGVDRSPTEEDVKSLLEMTTNEKGEPVDFRKRVLGPAHDEMVADGISGEGLQRVTNVVMAYYGLGEHVAQAILSSPGEAPARANRAARRSTAKKTAGSRSKKASGAGTGSAKATTSPTSVSSTSAGEPEAAKAV